MKHHLLTTIAAVVLVGCGNPEADRALLDAADDGNIKAVKQYLDDGADVNTKDNLGRTPLLWAALNGHKEIVELLIAEGADVNTKDTTDETPLHYVTGFGFRKEIAKLLIAKGANVNALDKFDRTPLDYVVERYDLYLPGQIKPFHLSASRYEIADLLRQNGSKHGTIHGAARGGEIEAVKEILDAGVDVNASQVVLSPVGMTALHEAVRCGHKDIAELLIDKDANVNAQQDDGITPLDYSEQHPEIADLLRKHGGKTGEELKAEGK
jgi:ankyrin repeat protein